MNKTILYILGGIVVAGAVVFFVVRGPSGNTPQAHVSPSTSGGKSLKSLLSLNAPQKCTFTQEVEGATLSGTVYAMKGKMHGEFSSTVAGQTVKSHMLVDGAINYIWTDMTNQGFKMTVNAAATPGTQPKGQVDINQNFNFSCTNWNVDNSLFELPKNVTFSELGAGSVQASTSVKPSTGGSDSAKEMQCNACNSIGEPQRTQCRTALNCK